MLSGGPLWGLFQASNGAEAARVLPAHAHARKMHRELGAEWTVEGS